mmetsp:Transcript_1983/g.3522  ORF Transcript_1983/g.3522 Transcript_1983/m.3522 type:complete len:246 (+) Transcript_1983:660-1397(+)
MIFQTLMTAPSPCSSYFWKRASLTSDGRCCSPKIPSHSRFHRYHARVFVVPSLFLCLYPVFANSTSFRNVLNLLNLPILPSHLHYASYSFLMNSCLCATSSLCRPCPFSRNFLFSRLEKTTQYLHAIVLDNSPTGQRDAEQVDAQHTRILPSVKLLEELRVHEQREQVDKDPDHQTVEQAVRSLRTVHRSMLVRDDGTHMLVAVHAHNKDLVGTLDLALDLSEDQKDRMRSDYSFSSMNLRISAI